MKKIVNFAIVSQKRWTSRAFYCLSILCGFYIVLIVYSHYMKGQRRNEKENVLALLKFANEFALQNQSLGLSIPVAMSEFQVHSMLYENCKAEVNSINVKLDNDNNVVLSMQEYKKQFSKNYTQKHSVCLKKKKISSTLSPTLKQGLDPRDALNDLELVLNVSQINFLLERLKEERIRRDRDDDILKIPEVIHELQEKKYKIPNIVHFVSFGYNEFLVHNYIALICRVVGAWRYQRPAAILYHCDKEPFGEYWVAAKKKCGVKLKIVKRSPPKKVYQRSLSKWEHQSDVARLEILMEVGGIYLDTDSVVLKSLDVFRHHDMVLGQPHRKYAAENAIMLANRNSWFLRRWYYEYQFFKQESWGFNSLQVPGSIAYFFPSTVHLTFTELCRPHWEEINMIYRSVFEWNLIYVMHLYQRLLPRTDCVPERPLKQLAVLNTTYGEIARHVIWGDKRIRDVTDWIVTCDLEKYLDI